jgi:hypothetical protein
MVEREPERLTELHAIEGRTASFRVLWPELLVVVGLIVMVVGVGVELDAGTGLLMVLGGLAAFVGGVAIA